MKFHHALPPRTLAVACLRPASRLLLAAVFVTSLGTAVAQPQPAAVPLTIDWNLSAAQIDASCKAEIARADARITALTRMRSARTFDTVVSPLDTITADLNDATAAQQFLDSVSTEKSVRDASQACNSQEAAFLSEVTARPAVFEALKAAQASNTATGDAQKKLTELWLSASSRAGAGLPDAARTEFVKLSAQLSELENRFGSNLADDASSMTVSTAQAAGLPADFLAGLKRSAGGYVVPVNESSYETFLQNAGDERAREIFYRAFVNRAASKNVALLEQAVAIRDRLAHLLGYPSWAAYQLADKMAGTPQRVQTFLANLDTQILPKARVERAQLAALKGTLPFESWDTLFYEAKLRQRNYNVDEDAIKQYFPSQHTVDAIFGIYAKLFSVSFAPLAQAAVYNPEVKAYAVHDAATGGLLGTFYLDLYPRPGKYDHFAHFGIIARRVLPDGTVRAPFSAIVGNWQRPAPGRPALLSHNEVEIFFHEFGHNMAAMLADGSYATLTSGFRSDFVEAPSQMLENWAWDPGILKLISSNVTTGAPLPDPLIRQMIAARYLDYSLFTTQQIAYATADMTFHSSGAHVDTTRVWKNAIDTLTPNPFVDGTHPQASFGHLMGGYDAGYYGYLWSKVYAQDLFSAFKAGGLESAVVGRRYRNAVLAPARTYEPDAEVAAFLGRPMSPTAFYAELGITPQTTMR